MIRAVRYILGQLILFIDWITRPRKPRRSESVQAQIDQETGSMALYQFRLCPFCVKTRRNMRRLGLNIETRDAMNDPQYKQQLVEQGGEYKVPCLAIEEEGKTRWMYESSEIIAYLDKRFGGR